MSPQDKLIAVKKAIQEAVPEIAMMTKEQRAIQDIAESCHLVGDIQGLNACNQITEIFGNTIGRPIMIDDVLRACPKEHRIQIDSNGSMELEEEHNEYGWFPDWLLGKSLDDQSEETTSALYDLLITNQNK